MAQRAVVPEGQIINAMKFLSTFREDGGVTAEQIIRYIFADRALPERIYRTSEYNYVRTTMDKLRASGRVVMLSKKKGNQHLYVLAAEESPQPLPPQQAAAQKTVGIKAVPSDELKDLVRGLRQEIKGLLHAIDRLGLRMDLTRLDEDQAPVVVLKPPKRRWWRFWSRVHTS